MSINVKFYTNTSDKRYLTKTLTNEVSKDCQITEDCDILNPTLEVNIFSGLSSKNYMYISNWKRKYFIDSITVTSGGRAIIKGHIDVLSTYATEIKKLPAIVCRQEKIYNNYLNDEFYQTKQYKITTVQNFSRNPFSHNGSLVLAVTGSAHNI